MIRAFILPLILALLMAGCNMFAPEASQQTLQAERDIRGTSVALAAQTATPQSQRYAVTLESALTAVGRARIQTTSIAATMLALGTPFIDTRFITPMPPESGDSSETQPQIGGANDLGITVPIIQPTIVGQGGAQGNSDIVNPADFTPVPTATIDPTLPTLANIVTASGVGANDCAVGSISDFPTASSGVYVVANAVNLPAGAQITAHFLREGVEQIYYEWSPSFDIPDGCIWFYMPAGDVSFSPGIWSVQFDLNGTPYGSPLPFTVSGSPVIEAAEGM
ncbi:MAG: hypothetical protein IAE89_08590 [Anaerolineae bacterium]|nr:hypothetical protein [Anaerolineae bacterium]